MSIGPRVIQDITAANLSQVPASRGQTAIQWIVIHYLGVPNADNPNLYGGGYGGHYYVSRAGSVYKAADPRTAVVWQCGGGLQGSGGHQYHNICTNFNSIGIENGVGYDSDWYFTTETQESLVYLVSQLMDEYGIDINHVIRHYDVTGKNCPAPYVSNNKNRTSWTWDEFKQKLAEYRNGGGDEDKMISDVFKKRRVSKGYNQHQYRTVDVKDGSYLNVRLAPDESAPKHPYWGKLSKGNGVQEICRFDNGWSCVYIVAGKGTGTIGYVNSAYLK